MRVGGRLDQALTVRELARLPQLTLKRIAEAAQHADETVWELSVHTAMRGNFLPAFEKLLASEVPPPRIRAALEKALARAKKGGKGRPPKKYYVGPLTEQATGLSACSPKVLQAKGGGHGKEKVAESLQSRKA